MTLGGKKAHTAICQENKNPQNLRPWACVLILKISEMNDNMFKFYHEMLISPPCDSATCTLWEEGRAWRNI